MVLSRILSLRQLDMKKVSEDERRIAIAMYQKEEERRREMEKFASNKERRRQTIQNVQRQWLEQKHCMSFYPSSNPSLSPTSKRETDYESMSNQASEIFETQSIGSAKKSSRGHSAKSDASKEDSGVRSRSKSRTSQRSESVLSTNTLIHEELQRTVHPGSVPNINRKMLSSAVESPYLLEIESENILNFYGAKALDDIDNQLNSNLNNQITVITFRYIDLNKISKYFIKIRNKFPNLASLVFNNCNFQYLSQLNLLGDLKKLENLTINKDDNPITNISIWKYYALFRLSHLQLKQMDNKVISIEEQLFGEKLFGPLVDLTLELPEHRLTLSLGQHRKKQVKLAKEENSQNSIDCVTARESVVKTFISNYTAKKSSSNPENQLKHGFVKNFIEEILSNTSYNDLKKQKLKQMAPQLWNDYLSSCVYDALNPTAYVNNLCKKHKIVF